MKALSSVEITSATPRLALSAKPDPVGASAPIVLLMILIVGHGPSADVDPQWVDAQEIVVRLFTGSINKGKGEFVPTLGERVDVIVTPTPKRIYEGPTWWLIGDYDLPVSGRKLSTGTAACLIANIEYPEKEIGVIGFDTTLHGKWDAIDWPYHDAEAEGEILRSIGVIDYGKDV